MQVIPSPSGRGPGRGGQPWLPIDFRSPHPSLLPEEARGFYEAYPEIAGLYYLSSLTNRPAIALYERANTPALFPKNTGFHRALVDPLMHKALNVIVDEIGYGLV